MKKTLLVTAILFFMTGLAHTGYAIQLVLWNKLGSEHEVTHSEVGDNGTIIGNINYESTQFSNGAYSNNLINNYIEFSNLGLDGDAFTIEFWVKIKQDYIYNAPSEYGMFFVGFTSSDDYQYALNWSGHHNRLFSELGPVRLTTRWNGVSFVEDDLYHVAYVADRSLSGYDRLSLFINGIKQTHYPHADYGNSSGDFDKIWLLQDQNNDFSGDFVMDNIKIWDGAKTDFSDRFDENAGAPVPEPATLILLGFGIVGLIRRKMRK